MDLRIEGRKAIVCASSDGLGRACAQSLADAGCELVINGRRREKLEETAAALRESTGARVTTVVADVATPEGRNALFAACPEPDILVNNAGGPPKKDFRELTPEDWSRAIDANFLAAVATITHCVDGMMARGFGRIVNVTSMTSVRPFINLDLSNATRLGLTGFVAGVSRQVAARNVTINNLLPGSFATERAKALGGNVQKISAAIPAGRYGDPAEFGDTCAFLCSASAAYITGQNILIDGGFCMNTL
jgi:3-oxoacyl-[acyl-carrier protein] reductase